MASAPQGGGGFPGKPDIMKGFAAPLLKTALWGGGGMLRALDYANSLFSWFLISEQDYSKTRGASPEGLGKGQICVAPRCCATPFRFSPNPLIIPRRSENPANPPPLFKFWFKSCYPISETPPPPPPCAALRPGHVRLGYSRQ